MSRTLIQQLLHPAPSIKKEAKETVVCAQNPDHELTAKLEKFQSFSTGFKSRFVKQAEALGMDRRNIFDAFAFLERSAIAEKRGEYIQWLNTIHRNA